MASKALSLEQFIAIIPNLEFSEPAPFKNQAGGARITVKAPGSDFVKVQLSVEKDALYCPFGCGRKPTRMEGKTPVFDDSQPPSYSTSFSIAPGSRQHVAITKLEDKLKEEAIKNPSWFAKLPPQKRKNPEVTMTPLLKEPTASANGEIKYPDYTLRVNTKPKIIKAMTLMPDRRVIPAKTDPHLAITPKSRCIPIINLGYIYVTNMGWGVTWYLDQVMVIPGEATATAGMDAFSGLGDDMQLDETAEVPVPVPQQDATPAVPSLQQVPGGQQALAEGGRHTMSAPFDLDDVLMQG